MHYEAVVLIEFVEICIALFSLLCRIIVRLLANGSLGPGGRAERKWLVSPRRRLVKKGMPIGMGCRQEMGVEFFKFSSSRKLVQLGGKT